MVLGLVIAALVLIGAREFAVAVRSWDDMTQEGPQMRLHNMARLISHIAVIVMTFSIGWEMVTLHNTVLNDNAGNTVLSTSDVVAKWCLYVSAGLLVIAGCWKLTDLYFKRLRSSTHPMADAAPSRAPHAVTPGFERGARG